MEVWRLETGTSVAHLNITVAIYLVLAHWNCRSTVDKSAYLWKFFLIFKCQQLTQIKEKICSIHYTVQTKKENSYEPESGHSPPSATSNLKWNEIRRQKLTDRKKKNNKSQQSFGCKLHKIQLQLVFYRRRYFLSYARKKNPSRCRQDADRAGSSNQMTVSIISPHSFPGPSKVSASSASSSGSTWWHSGNSAEKSCHALGFTPPHYTY